VARAVRARSACCGLPMDPTQNTREPNKHLEGNASRPVAVAGGSGVSYTSHTARHLPTINAASRAHKRGQKPNTPLQYNDVQWLCGRRGIT
jgi:hypothetical protein